MTFDPHEMSPDDQKYWQAIEAWKAKRLHSGARRLIPSSWRDAAARASDKTREKVNTAAGKIPNAEKFAQLLAQAVHGLTEAGARAGGASVRKQAVLERYREHDYHVEEIADIRSLKCSDVQKVKPRLDLAYIAGSAAQGAGTGLMASGGALLARGRAVGAGGASKAPGMGVIVGAVAADAAASVVTSNRAVAHVATYYGYDVDELGERIYALGVLNVGLAGDTGKLFAYRELNDIVQRLARRQSWKQLDRNGVARAVRGVYEFFGGKLSKEKLGTAVPVVGVAVGAGLNAFSLARVVDDAEHIYMERFLREKYGLPLDNEDVKTDGGLADLIEERIRDEQSDRRRNAIE